MTGVILKTTAYLRVGLNPNTERVHIAASSQPNHRPLSTTNGTPMPTVAFGIELDIADVMFQQAAQIIGSLTISEEAAQVAAEVSQP
jgi:hypothetical protein